MRTVDGYELKPCPFCGWEVDDDCFTIVRYPHMMVYVECNNPDCNATGPVDLGKSGAAEKWNDRQEATDV